MSEEHGEDAAKDSMVPGPHEVAGEDATEDSTVPRPHEVLKESELAYDPEVAKDPENVETDDEIPEADVQEGGPDLDGEENIDVVD